MTTARFSLPASVALLLIMMFIPLVHAADCPSGCSCLLPEEAKTAGYDACGGKMTVCGYASSGAAKYCYATTRATQKPAVTGFTGSECPQVSGLTLIGGITYAQAGIPNRDGLNCQYSLPGSCPDPNEPCSANIVIDRTLSPGAARDLIDTNFPPAGIAEMKRIYTVVDSGQSPDHPYIIIKNDPGANYKYPRSTHFESAILYRDVYVIEVVSAGYWVTSDATAKATLTALENGGKSVVDRTPLQPTTKPSTTKSSVTTTPRGTLTSGGTGVTINPPGYIAWPTPENPGESEALQQFLNDILGGFESGPDEDGDFAQSGPVDWSGIPAAASASMTPAVIGALGAFAGIALGAYTILPPGGFSQDEGQEGGDSEWPEGGMVDPTSDGTGRTALEVVEQGGNTDLEQAAMGAGLESVDQLAAPPGSEPGPDTENTVSSPQSSNIPEMTPGESPSYDDEVETLHKFKNLRASVDTIIKQRSAQGYYVMNPGAVQKIWNFTLGGAIHWVTAATDGLGITKNRTWTGGTCGNLSGWGQQWLTDDVKKIFGPDVNVNELVINPGGWANHAANQIVLPNGDRYIIDMWEGMSKGSSRVYTEDEWLAKWKPVFGQDAPLLRSNHENDLEVYIQKMGVKDGTDEFLTRYKNSPLAQITVKSFRNNPWFKPNPLPEV